MTTKHRGGRRTGAGRPPKAIQDRKPFKNGVAIRIDLETASLAQQLMMHDWPSVRNVEQLFAYALRRLAETTND